MGNRQISLQIPATVGGKVQKMFVIKDQSPLKGIAFTIDKKAEADLLESRVKSLSRGINSQLESCVIEFPNKRFGSHIEYGIPVKIAAETTNNIIFRGFLTDEIGVLNNDDDVVSSMMHGYKWLFSRLGKLRGQFYTIDSRISPPNNALDGDKKPTGDSTLTINNLANQRTFEKFRLDRVTDQIAGFRGSVRMIFNEEEVDSKGKVVKGKAMKTCATNSYREDAPIVFIYKSAETSAVRTSYFWDYAQILQHIFRYWIKPYFDDDSPVKIKLNQTGLQQILDRGRELYQSENDIVPQNLERPGIEYISPVGLDLTGLNPMEAFDKVVKAIPGNWIWRIRYFPDTVMLDVRDVTKIDQRPKSLVIGSNQKVAVGDNRTNVATINVTRTIKDRINHAITVGGPLSVETTIRLQPAWPRYVRNTTDDLVSELSGTLHTVGSLEAFTQYNGQTLTIDQYISDFKNVIDYEKWTEYIIAKKRKIEGSQDDMKRWDNVYKAYKLFTGELGDQTKPDFTFGDLKLPDSIKKQYVNFVDNVTDLFLPKLKIIRKIGGITREVELTDGSIKYNNDKPFTFTYDPSFESVFLNKVDVNDGWNSDGDIRLDVNTIVINDRGYDATALAASFISTDQEDKLKRMAWDANHNVQYKDDNNLVIFTDPQYQRQPLAFDIIDKAPLPKFIDMKSKIVFMTCSINTDLPFILDQISEDKVALYNGLRLMGYHLDFEKSITVRVDAFYPSADGQFTRALTYSETTGIISQGDTIIEDLMKAYPVIDANAPVMDWNLLELNEFQTIVIGEPAQREAVLVEETLNTFVQILNDIMKSLPDFGDTFAVGLGRLDLDFEIGDTVSEIINSEKEADDVIDGGYYNLDTYITSLSITAVGDFDSYDVKFTMKNRGVPTKVQRTARGK